MTKKVTKAKSVIKKTGKSKRKLDNFEVGKTLLILEKIKNDLDLIDIPPMSKSLKDLLAGIELYPNHHLSVLENISNLHINQANLFQNSFSSIFTNQIINLGRIPKMDLGIERILGLTSSFSHIQESIKSVTFLNSNNYGHLGLAQSTITQFNKQLSDIGKNPIYDFFNQQTIDTIFPYSSGSLDFFSFEKSSISQLLRTINFGSTSILSEFTESISKMKFEAGTDSVRFGIEYENKKTVIKEQVTVNLQEYDQLENGLGIGPTITKNGELYRMVLVKEQSLEVLSNSYSTIALDYENGDKATITVDALTDGQPKIDTTKKEDWLFSYDHTQGLITVGPYNYLQIKPYNLVGRFLKILSQEDDLDKIWYYEDLYDLDDREEKNNRNAVKKASDAFYYLKNKLPVEIQDLFDVKLQYLRINKKYLK